MEWKYVKTLKDNSIFKYLEDMYMIKIPEKLKEIIIENNGGRPEKRLFKIENNKEKVFKSLISLNREDKENIFIFDDILKRKYFPFAITEFGDLICVNSKKNNVELYNHELNKFEYICENVENFFKSLYN